MNRIISLASDTETRPTPAMRQAIANAEEDDEQRGEDLSVNRLQERMAQLLGHAAVLWLPGGTMYTFISMRVHTRPADAVLCGSNAAIATSASPPRPACTRCHLKRKHYHDINP